MSNSLLRTSAYMKARLATSATSHMTLTGQVSLSSPSDSAWSKPNKRSVVGSVHRLAAFFLASGIKNTLRYLPSLINQRTLINQMPSLLSDSQELALTTMSSRGRSTTRGIEQRTLKSLEKAKLIVCIDDEWRLTVAGKYIVVSIDKYKPTGALAALLDMSLEITKCSTAPYPHQLRYLAEKILELFGPAINKNPEAKRAFIGVLAGLTNTRQIAL